MTTTCTQCSTPASTSCARCGTALCPEHAITGQPLITARQLVSTTVTTAVRAPGLLGDVLLKELPQVSYCSTCREEVGQRRQTEQLKFSAGLLLALLVIVGLPLFLLLG